MKANSEGGLSVFSLRIAAAGVIILGVVLFLFFLYKGAAKETEIVMSSTSFEIKDMYGAVYDSNAVSSIELKDLIPAITTKTNGTDIGEIRKGDFLLENMGKCRLHLNSNEGPFLVIKVAGKYVIINFKEGGKTKQLYQDMIGKYNKK